MASNYLENTIKACGIDEMTHSKELSGPVFVIGCIVVVISYIYWTVWYNRWWKAGFPIPPWKHIKISNEDKEI